MPALTSNPYTALLLESGDYLLLEDGSHLLLETGQLEALRAQPHTSKSYLAVLAPQVNRVMLGTVTQIVITNDTTYSYVIAFTPVSGSYLNVAEGMTLWVGTSADDYSLGRVRVKSASFNYPIAAAYTLIIAETSDLAVAVGSTLSVYNEYLPWGKLPFIGTDGSVWKDADIAFTANPNQQTKLWPPIAMMGSAAVGVIANGIAYVYFNGVTSYPTAPGASITSYSWTFPGGTPASYGPSGTAYTPGYVSFTAQGVHQCQLTVVDSNGTSTTTTRPILIVDPLSPLYPYYAYTAFELSRFDGDIDTGWGVSVKVYGQSDVTYFPNGAVVMLYSDDTYGGVKNSMSGSQGPLHGNTFADDASVGTVAWSNPSNALALDGVYATATIVGVTTTHYLYASNFGFSLPTSANIVGIVVSITIKASLGAVVSDNSIKLFVAGVPAGSNLAVAPFLPTVDTKRTYGSSTNLWGLTPSVAQVNASNFGVGFSYNVNYVTASVDYIDMTVYYYDDTGIGFEAHRTNVKYVGYLLEDSISVNPQASTVEFDSGGIARVLEKQYMRPTFVQDKLVPSTWSEAYALTMRRATLYYTYWHTTIHEIADAYIEGDSTPIAIADFPKQSVWEMLRNWVSAKRMMHAGVTKNGRVEIRIDAQAYTLAQRNVLDVVMQLTSADWQGEVAITESPLDSVAFADVSGQWYEGSPSAAPIPIFSKAPGFTPSAYGRDLAVQYLASTGQLDMNALAGNVFRWRNNDYPRVVLTMAGNWVSAFDPAYQEYTQAPSVGFPSHRGAQLAGLRLLLRQMSNTFNNSGGYWTSTLTFEVESPTTPSGVIGDYPSGALAQGAEACPLGAVWNKATRVCDVLGTTPSQYPWSGTWRNTVIVATLNKGVFITNNFSGPSGSDNTVWTPINSGLATFTGGTVQVNQMTSDPYNPSFLYLTINGTGVGSILYRFDPLIGTWKRLWDAAALGTNQGIATTTSAYFSSIVHDWLKPAGWVGVFLSNLEGASSSTWFMFSSDYGSTFGSPVKISNGAASAIMQRRGAVSYFAGGSGTPVSTLLYAPLATDIGTGAGVLYKSTDSGATWASTGVNTPNFARSYFFIDPSNHDNLWTAETDIKQYTAQGGAVATKLAGVGNVLGSLAYRYAISVMYNPSGDAQVVRTFDTRDASHKARLYSTADGGGTWTNKDGAALPVSAYPFGVVELWDAPGKLYAVSKNSPASANHQVWVSQDAGLTWVGKSGSAAGYASPSDGTGIPFDAGGIVDIVIPFNT